MKNPKTFFSRTAVLFCATLFGGCTQSPFENKIATEPKQIFGKVDLVDTPVNDEKGVYVWLSTLNLGTFTDSTGAFRLEIPKNVAKDFGGVFTLYFYVANYRLQTATVAVRNGQFLYGSNDLNATGHLINVVRLFKMLDIATIVEPDHVVSSFSGPINVQTTLQAIHDTVVVVFPKSVGGLLGGMLFRHTTTGKIHLDIADVGANTRDRTAVGREPKSRRQVFELNGANYRSLYLPVGEYIVVPFFLIEQEGLPSELIASFGEKADDITPNYLKIPFRRKEARFYVE